MALQDSPPAKAGNPDLYGIGFRTGVYCQWLATLAANAFDLEAEIAATQMINLCFQIALIAALLFIITGKSSVTLSAPEVPIVLSLCFGGFAAANAARLSQPTPETAGTSFVRSFCMAQLFGIVAGVNSWFWWRGVGLLDPMKLDDMFFFTRLKIHRLRVFFCVLSVLACLLFVLLEAIYILIIFRACRHSGVSKTAKAILRAHQQGFTPKMKSVWQRYAANAACMMFLIFMALTVELTLLWNDFGTAHDFDTVGQLIPLVVSIGNLIKVIYTGYKKSCDVADLDTMGFERPQVRGC